MKEYAQEQSIIMSLLYIVHHTQLVCATNICSESWKEEKEKKLN
jgi:hypothetical protein